MLIEALANLADRTGAERISLEIPPSNNGSCAVLVVTSFGQKAHVGESKDSGRLLAALSTPLVVEGHVGELDSRLVALIDELEEDIVTASQSLPETDAQKRKRELQEAAAKKAEKSDSSATKKKAKKKGKKTSETAESEPETSNASHEDALASGDADSL
jgi:hypothetical protein